MALLILGMVLVVSYCQIAVALNRLIRQISDRVSFCHFSLRKSGWWQSYGAVILFGPKRLNLAFSANQIKAASVHITDKRMAIFNIQPNFWFYWFVFCGIMMGGYFATASGMYWLLYSVLGKERSDSQKSNDEHRQETIVDDIKLSVVSVVFFALAASCFMLCYRAGITKVYTHLQLKDIGYIAFSYIAVLLLQDTYFYFTHRLLHLPLLFKWAHQGHHQSRPPTPWTFFALEPTEAIAQAIFLLSIIWIVPLHLGVLVAILITMAVWTVGNHLGLQVVPVSKTSSWWGRWLIGSTHHLIHHQRYNRHYGLYFTFWDRLLGTEDVRYETKPAVLNQSLL